MFLTGPRQYPLCRHRHHYHHPPSPSPSSSQSSTTSSSFIIIFISIFIIQYRFRRPYDHQKVSWWWWSSSSLSSCHYVIITYTIIDISFLYLSLSLNVIFAIYHRATTIYELVFGSVIVTKYMCFKLIDILYHIVTNTFAEIWNSDPGIFSWPLCSCICRCIHMVLIYFLREYGMCIDTSCLSFPYLQLF